MSGYLRSLAERALGLASGVRPARGLPSFAGEPSQTGGTLPPAEYAGAPSAQMPPPDSFDVAEPQIGSAPPEMTRAAQIGEPAEAPAAMPMTTRHGRLAPLANAHSDDIPAGAVSHDALAPRQQRSAASAQPDAPAERRFARQTVLEHANRPSEQADRPSEQADPSTADDRARIFQREERARAEDAPQPEFSGHVRPAPQLPAAPRMTTRLVRNRFIDLTQSRLEGASPAPDVHIHIGRVELTAIAPATPPRRESTANAKKPMSLEEYLRRRSGRPA